MTWLALLGWGRSVLQAVLRLATRYPWQCLLVLSLAWGVHEHRQHNAWRDYAKRLEVASKQAAQEQAIVIHVPAAKSQAIAEKSNVEAPAYYRSVHDAADRHAVRVRAPASSPVDPALPGTDQALESFHGPDSAPLLVCRPGPEDQQLVGAAARAAEMHQEALDLITEGVATGADDPPVP